MPELDYRDVRADHVSVADLLDFDALLARLSDADRTVVLRKIAHEVAESEPAQLFTRLEDARSRMEYALEDAKISLAEAEEKTRELAAEVETLKGDVRQLEKDVALGDENLMDLRREYTEAVTRHARELQEAEVRGYQRGRDDAQAA